jgi:hypothetical protein
MVKLFLGYKVFNKLRKFLYLSVKTVILLKSEVGRKLLKYFFLLF